MSVSVYGMFPPGPTRENGWQTDEDEAIDREGKGQDGNVASQLPRLATAAPVRDGLQLLMQSSGVHAGRVVHTDLGEGGGAGA